LYYERLLNNWIFKLFFTRGKNMRANRKFVEEDEAVSAVIGVILMVAITVAVAATVYVYTSGIGSTPSRLETAAVATGEGTDDQIKLILAHGGEHYGDGYNVSQDVNIYINGSKVANYNTEIWITGGQIFLGLNGANWEEGYNCPADHYEVTVSIRDNVVYDGTITVGG
jgi:flagellin-like protein